MRLSSVRYLLREGFRSIWQNRVMAAASIGVLISCLLLTGGSYLGFANINHMFDVVYSQNVVVAYAKSGTDAQGVVALGDEIRGITNVAKAEFMSKDEILDKYRDSFSPELFEQLKGDNNPMQDAYVVTFTDLAKFDATLMQIQSLSKVDSVSYSDDIAKTLTTLRNVVLIAGGWVIALLLVVSLFIISNTIKLTVYNRRLEIGIMKSVGATNTFIRVPFVVEGVTLGLIAGGLTYGITCFVYTRLEGMFDLGPFVGGLIPFGDLSLLLLAGCLVGGMLTGMLGSAISIRKYLKDEGRAALE